MFLPGILKVSIPHEAVSPLQGTSLEIQAPCLIASSPLCWVHQPPELVYKIEQLPSFTNDEFNAHIIQKSSMFIYHSHGSQLRHHFQEKLLLLIMQIVVQIVAPQQQLLPLSQLLSRSKITFLLYCIFCSCYSTLSLFVIPWYSISSALSESIKNAYVDLACSACR